MNEHYSGVDQVPVGYNQTQAVYDVALNFYGNDWTDTQDVIEFGLNGGVSGLGNIFFHPQYGALSTLSSIANSNYHAGTRAFASVSELP